MAEVRALVAAEPAAGAGATGVAEWLERLCLAALRALPATGAGVSVMTERGVRAVAAASDPVSATLEELQFTMGEGPCLDAFASRRPVLEPDLGAEGMRRWPGYSPAAHERGVRSVFAFPLQIGAARLGVMHVHRHSPGSLSGSAFARALTFAEVAVEGLLDGQAQACEGRAPAGLDRALHSEHAVYQAQGMVMVDLGVTLADAMARLRAHAYAEDLPLREVAREVVAGRLRLDPDRA
jgi:ANTAR domain/GAF domain